MRGAIPPLPNMLSWRGAQLKHRDSFTFTLDGIIIGTFLVFFCNIPKIIDLIF